MTVRSVIRGVGSYLPSNVVTNDELAQRIDTTDEWIRERTGIRQRHVAADDETTSDLAINAGRQALERAGIDGTDIDMFVVATATPDHTFPATAAKCSSRFGTAWSAVFRYSSGLFGVCVRALRGQ